MKHSKVTISTDIRTPTHIKFRCPDDYTTCKYYHEDNELNSRCITDSNIGICIVELLRFGKEIDDFLLNEYDKSEVLTGDGDRE